MSTVIPFDRKSTRVPLVRSGPQDRVVYTVAEVARMLTISVGSAYALVRDGTIPAMKIGGRWVIPKTRFHVWLDGQTDDGQPVASNQGDGTGERWR